MCLAQKRMCVSIENYRRHRCYHLSSIVLLFVSGNERIKKEKRIKVTSSSSIRVVYKYLLFFNVFAIFLFFFALASSFFWSVFFPSFSFLKSRLDDTQLEIICFCYYFCLFSLLRLYTHFFANFAISPIVDLLQTVAGFAFQCVVWFIKN